MCRGGRMFAPLKVWRRWHRKVNQNQKRFAVASALAASALPALLLARGHRIEKVCAARLSPPSPVFFYLFKKCIIFIGPRGSPRRWRWCRVAHQDQGCRRSPQARCRQR